MHTFYLTFFFFRASFLSRLDMSNRKYRIGLLADGLVDIVLEFFIKVGYPTSPLPLYRRAFFSFSGVKLKQSVDKNVDIVLFTEYDVYKYQRTRE